MLIVRDTDLLLIDGAYLRVRNDRRKKQGMCFAAHRASDSADVQTYGAIRKFDASMVVAMNGHAGRMTTATGYLMQLNTMNDRIIKGLRNMVAILDKNGYHSIVDRHGFIHACGEWRTGLS